MKTGVTLPSRRLSRKQPRLNAHICGIFAAILLSLGGIGTARAGLADLFTPLPNRDWQDTRLADDPAETAKKLTTWLKVTTTSQEIDTKTLVRFALENSDWPKLGAFRERIEKHADDLHATDAAAWFDQYPPRTANGLKVYLASLAVLKQDTKIIPALKKFWLNAELDKKDTGFVAAQYQRLFDRQDHLERLDSLLWQQRFAEAEAMMPLVDAGTQKLAEARIALGRLSSKAPKVLKAVPKNLQGDEGLLYSRLKWRREMDKDNDAYDLLMHAPQSPQHAGDWWRERNILARRFIEKRNFSRAYQIIAGHGMTPQAGADYSVAEWTAGWLDLEFLGHADKAYRHFGNFQKAVKAAVSKSRGGYWLGRAADKLHQPEDAKKWYALCAEYPSTFYGQICYEKVNGGPMAADALPDDQIQPQDQEEFNGNELVEVIHTLAEYKLHKYMDSFFIRLMDIASTRADFVAIAKLARESGRVHFAVEANKQLQMKLGGFMFTEGYPLLPPVSVSRPESALIHAIVHRESMFNAAAASPAGARGLMQLMPGTARQVARGIGKSYSADRLTENPAYNIELGAAYLQSLVEDYDGFYPLAIAAYNAGPANVRQWIKEFGDPRSKKVNLLDWIEEIPIYETRNYIQRVMESYYIYKLRLDEEPKTITAFKKG